MPPGEELLYYIVEPEDKKPISPFLFEKWVKGAVGSIHSCKSIRDGFAIITSPAKATNLQEIMCGERKMLVKEHPFLNSKQGLVKVDNFKAASDNEILEELKSQAVIGIRRITVPVPVKVGEKPEYRENGLYILTFKKPTLPKRILVGLESIPVENYYPAPMRCVGCQRYGHKIKMCRNPPACGRCAEGHQTRDCKNTIVNCIHCEKPHSTTDRNCAKYSAEKAIIKYAVDNNLSFVEARRICTPQSQSNNYAAVVRNQSEIDDLKQQLAQMADTIKRQQRTIDQLLNLSTATSSTHPITTLINQPAQDRLILQQQMQSAQQLTSKRQRTDMETAQPPHQSPSKQFMDFAPTNPTTSIQTTTSSFNPTNNQLPMTTINETPQTNNTSTNQPQSTATERLDDDETMEYENQKVTCINIDELNPEQLKQLKDAFATASQSSKGNKSKKK